MTATDLVEAFVSTRQTLHEAGVEDEFFLDLITSRLLIERVGESNNQGWWDSRILSETGRARLEEVTPKTQLQSRITLAAKVGQKAEADRLSADVISLFSLGPQVESRLTAAIEEIEAPASLSLEALENLSVRALDNGWTDDVLEQTGSNVTVDSHSLSEPDTGGSVCIDDDGYTQSEIEAEKWRLLVTLLSGYGYSTDRLVVPYYPLKSEFDSELA
ncbi:BrxE family protein [Natrinema halophilum]|uniref:BrxE family protein n=1 Tax=Natrinema halophilum TaxID=1699371 RepID=A0A7D5GNQ2_9EURY|nr:BrxE family protein [Natrinema halophilum]QLG49573.1 BrxE family protein [Natrinema halophilum]